MAIIFLNRLIFKPTMLITLPLCFAWGQSSLFAVLWILHLASAVAAYSAEAWGRREWIKPILGVMALTATTLTFDWFQVAWICLLSGLVFSQLLLAEDLPSFVSELAQLVFLAVTLSLLLVPHMYLDQSLVDAYSGVAWIPLTLVLSFIIILEGVALARKKPLLPGGDHVSSLLFALTVGFLVLLAVVVETHSELTLHTSIAVTLGAGIVFALVLTLLWNPFAEWGLGTVIARHLFPTNVSLDRWAQRMSELAMVSEDADQFLARAAEELRKASKLEKIEWKRGQRDGATIGEVTKHKMTHTRGGLEIVLWSTRRMSRVQSLLNYFRLEIMAFFYASKMREVRYAKEQSSLLVSEAGVRLSHDIKNILHSVKAMSDLSQTLKEEKLVSIVRNQLPEIGRRLEDALKMIDQPELELERSRSTISALLWWGRVTKRFDYIVDNFQLDPEIDEDDALLADLYDRAAENFVSNALKKKKEEPGIKISLSLKLQAEGGVELSVEDSGSRIDDGLAKELFKNRVGSRRGSGIGLHDLHGDAAFLGHRISLSKNDDGGVAFVLSPTADQGK